MLQMAMSALVALAGLFLVITAAADYRLFGWFLLVEAGTQLWYRSHEAGAPLPSPLSDFRLRTSDFPSLGITNVPIPEAISSQFRADESIEARWLELGVATASEEDDLETRYRAAMSALHGRRAARVSE